jgi:hypothetical protein
MLSSYAIYGTATQNNNVIHILLSGLGSSVSIATGYGLDSPGIESRWGERFFAHVQTGPGVHPASRTMGTGYFPGVKWPGNGADHPPPPSAGVADFRHIKEPLRLRGSWVQGKICRPFLTRAFLPR